MKKLLLILLLLSFNVHAQSAWSPRWLNAYGDVPINGDVYNVTGKANLAISSQGLANNCGISISGTTLTISNDATANNRYSTELSATDPCHIGIEAETGGVGTVFKVTAPVDITFGAASDTDGNLFGITDANWGSDMPFFLGVVSDPTLGSSNHKFIISRIPLRQTGVTTELCQLGATDCDGAADGMIVGTGLDLARWQSQQVTQVGWFLATYATSGGAWTFRTEGTVGFNKKYASARFNMPNAQMGASTGTHLRANGGTAPVFSTQEYEYMINENGRVFVEAYFNADGGSDGAGVVTAQLVLPYLYQSGSVTVFHGQPGYVSNTSITGTNVLVPIVTENTSIAELYYLDAAAQITTVTNSMFGNGARNIRLKMDYHALEN